MAAVAEMMWKICDSSDYIDNSAYRYMEIISEYLYEFDNYKDAGFDFLSEDKYKMFTSIVPSDDANIEVLMNSIYSVAMEYAYTGIPSGALDTLPYIENVETVIGSFYSFTLRTTIRIGTGDLRIAKSFIP